MAERSKGVGYCGFLVKGIMICLKRLMKYGGYDISTETALSFRVCELVSVIVWRFPCLYAKFVNNGIAMRKLRLKNKILILSDL